jgi:tetratricopeptide (TPR) repeat protein
MLQLSISARLARLRRLRAAAPASENSNGGSGLQHFHRNWIVLCLAGSIAGSSLPVLSQADPRQSAISLEQQGKNAEAEAAWQTVSKQQPSNPEPYAHLGLLEARQEHYPEAIGYYRKAMALAPAMPGLRLNLGLAHFKNGDYKQAIALFEPELKQKPDDLQLNILIGMSHYGLAQYAAASPYLMQAAKGDPQNLALLLTLAHTCLFSGQYPCVRESFHQIVALNAESAEAYMLMGEALDEMKDHEGAVREFRAAEKVNPKELNVHFGLGYLLWTKGQYPEAATEFQLEIDNDPQHLQAMLYLADSEMQMNQPDAARPLLEKLVKLNPGNAMAHRDLAIVYADQDRKQEALAEFQVAIKIAPHDVNAHWRLGRLYRSMGMTAEAKAEFDKASSLNKAEDDRLLKVMSTIPNKERPAPAAVAPPKQ